MKHSPTWEKNFKNQMEVLTKLLSNILILRVESHVKSQIFEMWYFDASVIYIYIYISIMILVITYWKYSSKSGTFALCFHQNPLHDCGTPASTLLDGTQLQLICLLVPVFFWGWIFATWADSKVDIWKCKVE